jgi:hypothetical protein
MIVSAAGTTESYRRRCVSVVPNGTDSNGRVRNPALKRRAIFIVPGTHSMKIEASSGEATPNRRAGSDVFLLLGVALLLDFIGFCNVPARRRCDPQLGRLHPWNGPGAAWKTKEKGEIRSPLVSIGWFRSYSGGSSSTPSPACTSSSAKTTMADDAVGVTFTTTTSPTARRGRSPT